jgi:hypothetical protein
MPEKLKQRIEARLALSAMLRCEVRHRRSIFDGRATCACQASGRQAAPKGMRFPESNPDCDFPIEVAALLKREQGAPIACPAALSFDSSG